MFYDVWREGGTQTVGHRIQSRQSRLGNVGYFLFVQLFFDACAECLKLLVQDRVQ